MPHEDQLVSAVLQVVCELHAIHEQLVAVNNNQAILHRLAHLEGKIMSAISEFGDTVNARFDEVNLAVDGVAADVDFLKAEIKKLQDNPGPISPADQLILDGVQARVNTLADKVKALNDATENPPTPTP